MTQLGTLYGRLERRTRELSERFLVSLQHAHIGVRPCETVHRDGRAYLVCRLQVLWGEFSRELIVQSALGGRQTRTGKVLTKAPTVNTMADIRRVLGESRLQGPRMRWEDPSFAVRHARTLKVANYDQINIGLGSASLDEIKPLRNFLVHPNEDTRLKYEQVIRNRGAQGICPDRFMLQPVFGGSTLFDTWIQRLLLAAWNSVE